MRPPKQRRAQGIYATHWYLACAARASGPCEVQKFGITKEQEREFKILLVKAMVTSCVAFNFAENG
jgi:hypothetical protein